MEVDSIENFSIFSTLRSKIIFIRFVVYIVKYLKFCKIIF